ncbi:hypothetical protein A4G99_23525 [Haladaptatus sp. R4]|nr:hypothetical protein A4G99_23525 [Haladaptatus sp. R4]
MPITLETLPIGWDGIYREVSVESSRHQCADDFRATWRELVYPVLLSYERTGQLGEMVVEVACIVDRNGVVQLRKRQSRGRICEYIKDGESGLVGKRTEH